MLPRNDSPSPSNWFVVNTVERVAVTVGAGAALGWVIGIIAAWLWLVTRDDTEVLWA